MAVDPSGDSSPTSPPPSAPATPADGGVVSARIIRVMLLALQKVAGRQYELLLTRAKLDRYLHTLPPDTWAPAATGAELAALFQAVYTMLGEDLTRLFHRNCGEAYGQLWATPEGTREARAALAVLPPDQHLGWFVHRMADTATRGWSPHAISEDATAWYLTAEFCAVCAGIRGVHRPLCAQAPALWTAQAQTLLGRRLRIIEVACAAMGAPHCKFAFYK